MLTEVTTFNEKFREVAQNEYEKFHQHAQSVPEDDLIRENEGNEDYVMYMLMDLSELETLVTVLEAFKENTENKISNYESTINGDITNDWNAISNAIDAAQKSRNRDIVKEIVENSKLFLESNEKKFADWAEQDENDA